MAFHLVGRVLRQEVIYVGYDLSHVMPSSLP